MAGIITLLFVLMMPRPGYTLNIDPSNDLYWHGGVMAACGYFGKELLSKYKGQWVADYPRLYTIIGCHLIGFGKEFLYDNKADRKDLMADAVGLFIGINLDFHW